MGKARKEKGELKQDDEYILSIRLLLSLSLPLRIYSESVFQLRIRIHPQPNPALWGTAVELISNTPLLISSVLQVVIEFEYSALPNSVSGLFHSDNLT